MSPVLGTTIPSWFSYSPGQGFWSLIKSWHSGTPPSSPVVKTLHFQCRRHGSTPVRGTKIPHAAQRHQKIGEKQTNKHSQTLLAFTTWSWSEVAELCPTLFDPMDCSLPGSSAHGIFQARVPEWGAISFSGHPPLQELNHVLLLLLTFHPLWKEFRVESRNQALC